VPRKRFGRFRPTPLRLYLASFILFVGATAAVAIGQFSAGSTVAPLMSLALSAGAVILTIAALFSRPGP
jgi:hypothetical protein